MDQDTNRDVAPLIDAAVQHPSRLKSEIIRESESEYCHSRADEESARADEATHPAARAAHLEMAARYRDRALSTW